MTSIVPFKEFNPFDEVNNCSAQLVKSQIRSLYDSYNGDWDILIELLQNAVDACEEEFSTIGSTGTPQIEVIVDLQRHIIQVSDNGIGIDTELAKKILAPNFTNKTPLFTRNAKKLRGHKGVGLTYVAYSSNNFKFCSKINGSFFSGELMDAKNWVLDDKSEVPLPLVKPSDYIPDFIEKASKGSSFQVTLDSSQLPDNLYYEGWEFILRTQTACGYFNINDEVEWVKKMELNLKVIDRNGEPLIPQNGNADIKFEFLKPHEGSVSKNLSDYYKKNRKATLPLEEKHKYDCIYEFWNHNDLLKFFFQRAQEGDEENTAFCFAKEQKASVYGVFVHSASIWKEMNKALTSDGRRKFWKPGIQIITKNMPTGKQFDASVTFTAGNKDRIFILISLENVRPDYGRKTFHDDVVSFSQSIANKCVKYFVENREFLKPTEIAASRPTSIDTENEVQSRIKTAEKLPGLGLPDDFAFEKVPQSEQGVVALFHELLGKNVLKGYKVLSVSSISQYDAVVRYTLQKDKDILYHEKYKPLGLQESYFHNKEKIELCPVNLEFKYDLVSLLGEFEGGQKNFEDIRFCVCWEISDLSPFGTSGYQLINLLEKEKNNYGKRLFHGTTHLLHSGARGKPINVICLKDIIGTLKI